MYEEWEESSYYDWFDILCVFLEIAYMYVLLKCCLGLQQFVVVFEW